MVQEGSTMYDKEESLQFRVFAFAFSIWGKGIIQYANVQPNTLSQDQKYVRC